MARKKGLLIAPEFPADSFWSYKHIIHYVKRKAAFPPLGLITFAAQLPADQWDLELIDLNIGKVPFETLREKIQAADAVFASGMNIQRESLVALLDGPARGTDTPWVLGGPMASTYRDTILHPQTESDHVLFEGLDILVWGESQPWIPDILQALEDQPRHRSDMPRLWIPERVLEEPEGSRDYLRDKTIFKPLDNLPLPRWDLLEVNDYRAMMIQTTAGCRFRCTFCDIVQFNGGFARAKNQSAVVRELQAIYDTGFRGGVFTVDDNFVSEPAAMEEILQGMIEFQRRNNYPFTFFTQASIDLGKDSLIHLMGLMRQAGFTSVFLGIESPDPETLRGMNKTQNIKTDPQTTVDRLQKHGIEVFAGFIYGTDGDTRQTADLIIDFVNDNGIFSSMTGKLTPMPHTPLYVELKLAGRLIEGHDPTNNIDESLQFTPIMGHAHLQEGFRHILSELFNRQSLYKRAQSVLDRVDMHIFRGKSVGLNEKLGVVRFLVGQGLKGRHGFLDREYFKLIKYAYQLDQKVRHALHLEGQELNHFWHRITATTRGQVVELDAHAIKRFTQMTKSAHEAMVRYSPDKPLREVQEFIRTTNEGLSHGRIGLDAARDIFDKSRHYLEAKKTMAQFPGQHLVKAFELGIVGVHYQTVVQNILALNEPVPVSELV
ncbi:MAG: radical SAM protein [bacterium]|nr:radical SAM protein [bacterium]